MDEKRFHFYVPSRVKSYNKFINFIVGGRGIGKTYGFKVDSIKHFKKTGKQFFYFKRHTTDMSTIDTFFNDISHEFPEDELSVKGGKKYNKFYINDEICGYSMPLSRYKTLKSSSFVNVDTIIFDEFLPEKGGYNLYIPNEVELFLNAIDSIFRQREGHVYLLANKTSISNPYFNYFNISVNPAKEFNTFKGSMMKEQILIQNCGDDYDKGSQEKSSFQKLISGTRYGDYNSGKFAYDTNDFIMRMTPNAKYICTIYADGIYFGCYVDFTEGKIFINRNVNMDYPAVYSIGKDMRENMILSKGWRNDRVLSMIVRNYRVGNVFYNDHSTKDIINRYLTLF